MPQSMRPNGKPCAITKGGDQVGDRRLDRCRPVGAGWPPRCDPGPTGSRADARFLRAIVSTGDNGRHSSREGGLLMPLLSAGGRRAISEGQRRRWQKVKDVQKAVIESAQSRRRLAAKLALQKPAKNGRSPSRSQRPLSPTVAAIPSRDPKKYRASDIAGQCLRAFLLECDRAAVARLPLGILEVSTNPNLCAVGEPQLLRTQVMQS